MSSKKAREGYLLIDNSNSPGIPEAMAAEMGILGFERKRFEGAIYTCNHCHAQVVKNFERTRPRAYCRGCDSYICDACEYVRSKTLTCRTMSQVIDEALTAAEKQAPEARNILLP